MNISNQKLVRHFVEGFDNPDTYVYPSQYPLKTHLTDDGRVVAVREVRVGGESGYFESQGNDFYQMLLFCRRIILASHSRLIHRTLCFLESKALELMVSAGMFRLLPIWYRAKLSDGDTHEALLYLTMISQDVRLGLNQGTIEHMRRLANLLHTSLPSDNPGWTNLIYRVVYSDRLAVSRAQWEELVRFDTDPQSDFLYMNSQIDHSLIYGYLLDRTRYGRLPQVIRLVKDQGGLLTFCWYEALCDKHRNRADPRRLDRRSSLECVIENSPATAAILLKNAKRLYTSMYEKQFGRPVEWTFEKEQNNVSS